MKALTAAILLLLLTVSAEAQRTELDHPAAGNGFPGDIAADMGVNTLLSSSLGSSITQNISQLEVVYAVIDGNFHFPDEANGFTGGANIRWQHGKCIDVGQGNCLNNTIGDVDAIAEPLDMSGQVALGHGIYMSSIIDGIAANSAIVPVTVDIKTPTTNLEYDIIFAQALQHVMDLIDNGVNIRVVSISMTSGLQFTSNCDVAFPVTAGKALQLRDQYDVAVLASAGNTSAEGSGFPACLSNIHSISGAYYRAGANAWIKDPTTAWGNTVDFVAPSIYRGPAFTNTSQIFGISNYLICTFDLSHCDNLSALGQGSTSVSTAAASGMLGTVFASQTDFFDRVSSVQFLHENAKSAYSDAPDGRIYNAIDLHGVVIDNPQGEVDIRVPDCPLIQTDCTGNNLQNWDFSPGAYADDFPTGEMHGEKSMDGGTTWETIMEDWFCVDIGTRGVVRGTRTTPWGTKQCYDDSVIVPQECAPCDQNHPDWPGCAGGGPLF